MISGRGDERGTAAGEEDSSGEAASGKDRGGSGREVGDPAARLGAELLGRGLRVAVGESCTGGLVLKRLTDVAGSSGWVAGGVVAYADRAKTHALGVPPELLREHGAVSEPVARALAEGAAREFGAELGIGVTGIAGPGGAVPGKPVGTVWFAVTLEGGTTARSARFPGDRAAVRAAAAEYAQTLAIRVLASRRRDLEADPPSGSLDANPRSTEG